MAIYGNRFSSRSRPFFIAEEAKLTGLCAAKRVTSPGELRKNFLWISRELHKVRRSFSPWKFQFCWSTDLSQS